MGVWGSYSVVEFERGCVLARVSITARPWARGAGMRGPDAGFRGVSGVWSRDHHLERIMTNVAARGSSGARGVVGRAFSLIELLVVIAIIALLIALLLPALSGAREAGLKSSTAAMSNELTTAAQRFGNDNAGRMPGYFSERQMGSDANDAEQDGEGMSAMENALLELGGTGVVLGRVGDPGLPGENVEAGIIEVGPSDDPAQRVVVNTNLIGAEGAYFSPDDKFVKVMTTGYQGSAEQQSAKSRGMPDVVDAWGNPLLVWSQDTAARGSIDPLSDADDTYTQFVRVTSDGAGAPGDTSGAAWFYLASNSCFIGAPQAGQSGGIDMGADPTGGPASVIGPGVDDAFSATERIRTLASLLGSPSSYVLAPDPNVNSIEEAEVEQIYPARPRARFIVHSAGRDGIYFSSRDSGWLENAHSGGAEFHIDFGNNFKSQGPTSERFTDNDGAFTNIDMLESFDDILSGAK